MRRSQAACIAALVTVAAMLDTRAEGNAASRPAAPITRVTEFRPIVWAEDGARTVQCSAPSALARRAGAWRCATGDRVLDPCFTIASDATRVICDADPAAGRAGVRYAATFASSASPQAAASDAPTEAPWKLVLASGEACTYLAIPADAGNGERITYVCSNGLQLVGDPQPGTTWTVKTADGRRVAVRAVWR